MEIKRDKYLNQLINKKKNGFIKVITGLRRSGKSYLMNVLFKKHLMENAVKKSQIISFAFDNQEDIVKLNKYLKKEPTLIYDARGNYKVNANKFYLYIKEMTLKHQQYYLLLDEIQLLDNFVLTLNGFLTHDNFDVYVTGSNSKMLSKDIITEFRGRGDQIYLYPLSFKEFYEARHLPYQEAYREYQYYGGMPLILSKRTDEDKKAYLKELFTEIYLKDITERNNVKETDSFERLLNVLASSIASFTNPSNLEKMFKSQAHITYNHETIKSHIEYLKDAFLIAEANRYNIKGKKYITANAKYFFTDIGLRNALINFRQDEPSHIMENIIYNDLCIKGYSVDVGIVEISEKNKNNNYVLKQLEIDFVCRKINQTIYIQSVYSIETLNKMIQEKRSLMHTNDNFRKIIIVNDSINSYITEEGIEVISLEEWLLKTNY